MLKAGSSHVDITCKVGDGLSGQLYLRESKEVLDPLEANGLYFESDGTQFLLISCDLLLLAASYTDKVCSLIEDKIGIPADSVLITCTHTHTGPYTPGFGGPLGQSNKEYRKFLQEKLISVAQKAFNNKRPVTVGCASGRARIGYNRRVCWEDESHTMYGNIYQPGFNGIEGPDDPEHTVLFVKDCEHDEIMAVVHNNSCHATCVGGGDKISADFPGKAREILRNSLKDDLPVLYLQGASGDTSPVNLSLSHKDRKSSMELYTETGQVAATETLRLLALNDGRSKGVKLGHKKEILKLRLRLPTTDELEEIRQQVKKEKQKEEPDPFITIIGKSIFSHYEKYKDNPYTRVAINAVRIGEWGLVTNPCEYYCQFGLNIKRRSPAAVTAISQLTDGFAGYCPTIYGILGGGYSAAISGWCYLEENAGYQMVESSAKLLHKLWDN